MSRAYHVYVAQYERCVSPHHWEICIRTRIETNAAGKMTESYGSIFHVQGHTNAWGFQRLDNVHWSNDSYRGKLQIGFAKANEIDAMEKVMRAVPCPNAENANDSWNCQNWVFEAIGDLQRAGFEIKCPPSFTALVNEMENARVAWDAGATSD
ncbi:hypothetical protein WOLCODRAFT_156986 [Wolfiporia cocos MD-104 SS10]|uniref:PPPDE domain-containing protein n=1 Tax=Wolfiporia cocos (strain MD-104) TaxID=742152 RepID=A0A2H3JHV7_WOLCO|nr:hypothetical protein WOLCODRAFT_156986 [Wolfiporia cocos MD-104 SS10]